MAKSVDPIVRDREIPPVSLLSGPHGPHSAGSQFPMVLFSLDRDFNDYVSCNCLFHFKKDHYKVI
jgi:hypothetical protein